MSKRILVVDDEIDTCEILQYNLEEDGYRVEFALSAEEALQKDVAAFDLVLLDVMMDGMSGFQFARLLRGRSDTAQIPIIFITALDSEDDTVRGLDIGADDYIAKPLSMRAVRARVKAVLRRTSQQEPEQDSNRISFGTLTIDTARKSATINGEQVQLTRLEFEIISLFLRNQGRLFSRESLINQCWTKGTVISDRTVDVCIARLRKKLVGYGNHIKARTGYGYTFE